MKNSGSGTMKLGITGGIGSGKTTVCKVFSVLGIPVFSADDEAKRIQDTDQELKKELNNIAGKDLYSKGTLDRPELARLIFRNNELLEKVNAVIHPAVFRSFREWVQKQNSPYAIMEAAILFESGAADMMDRVVTVVTPIEERIERLLRGNRLTREQIIERMNNQISDNVRIERSDYIIFNSDSDMIIPSVLGIHKEMVKLYQKSL